MLRVRGGLKEERNKSLEKNQCKIDNCEIESFDIITEIQEVKDTEKHHKERIDKNKDICKNLHSLYK